MTAALLVAQAAGNMFDSHSMEAVRRVLAMLPRDTADDIGAGLAAEVVVETEIGSLDTAVDRVGTLIAFERQRSSVHALAKACRFGTHTYRAVGRFDDALRLAKDAYELAVGHQLVEQAAQSGDICATILLEADRSDEAADWLEKSAGWARRISLSYMERSIAVQRIMLFLRRGDTAGARSAFAGHGDWSSTMTSREYLEVASVRCRLFAALGEREQLALAVRELATRLEISMSRIRHDSFVIALAIGLRALNRSREADELVCNYVTSWRRDTSPLPTELS